MTADWTQSRPAALWAAVFVALWGVALLATMTLGVNVGDELWFLQVVSRVSGGEVLYRDVFFNTTPGAVGLGVALSWVFGTDVFVGKLLASMAVTLGSLWCGLAARTLGASHAAAISVAVAGVALGASVQTSLYSPLATAATAGCMLAVLQWRAGGSERSAAWIALAGAAVGASFAFKHSIGVSTGAALVVALLIDRRAVTSRGLAGCVAAGAIVAALPLVVVLAQGGGPQLWEYGVSAKGAYVESAGVSWWSTLAELRGAIGSDEPRAVLVELVPWMPLVAGVLSLVALVFGRDRTTMAIGIAFTVAALANVYPRADLSHFLPAAPLLAFCIWLACHQIPAPQGRVLVGIGGAGAAAALAVLVISEARVITSGDRTRSTVPHLRGAWLSPANQLALRAGAAELAAAARGRPTLVVAGDAGGRYLVSGVPNPTPYDFPLVTAFGLDGEARTAAAVRAGRFPVVCLSTEVPRELAATRLEQAIVATMKPAANAGTCRVYRLPRDNPRRGR